MKMVKATIKLACALAIAGSASFVFSQAAFAHDDYVRQAPSPECETPRMIKSIQSRFKTQSKRVHHRPDWEIDALTHVHQHRYLPQDVHAGRSIARRYCHATAHFNDGSSRKIWYLIEGGMGFAGFGQSFVGSRQLVRDAFGNGPRINNVEFCIEGLDKWNVYNAHCSILR